MAAQRAVKLMVEVCGGRAAKGLIDANPGNPKDTRVTLTTERLQRVLGVEVPTAQARKILTALGFAARWVPPDRFVVRVPYWRTDVSIPDDVIEEIARIIGYDQLPTSQLRGEIPKFEPQLLTGLRERVREILSAAGMQEVITYSMTDLESLRKVISPEDLAINQPLRLANPMSREFEYARTTLRHSLLKTLAANVRHEPGLICLFETSRVYLPRDKDLPLEIETLCAVVSGRKPDRWGVPGPEQAGFYDAKSYLEHMLAALGVEAEYSAAADYAYLPGRTAEVFAAGDRIGVLGQVNPHVAAAFGIDRDVVMFEIDLQALLPHLSGVARYQRVSPFPSLEQDLAVIVDHDVPAARVLALIQKSELVRTATIFDVYAGDPIPKGRKSIAVSVSYQSKDKTLTDSQVAKERARIVERLKRELGAELRG
jgi:phenylalanyl-tRNA synthetase beta chain